MPSNGDKSPFPEFCGAGATLGLGKRRGSVMGNVVDYIPVESLDRWNQHLTQAELDRLEELLSAMADDEER
ncbi:hypothetical protein GCM10023259_001280 [Thermocatellispora tengchongensis]